MSDPFGYKDKRVVVSGCFSGIGRAAADLLLRAGAEVHGLDHRVPDLDIKSFAVTDLRDPAAIEQAVAALGGPIHGLFNCAGIGPTHPPLDVMKVNFIGLRHLTERVTALMPPGSAVVSIGSNGGAAWRRRLPEVLACVKTGAFDRAVGWCEQNPAATKDAYRFSKEAIVVWTLVNSATLIQRGIRINCTSPGTVQTPMLEEIEEAVSSAVVDVVAQPIGRRSDPAEQAWPLLMLNSDLAGYINGVDLPVDGGFIAAQSLLAAGASS